MRVCRLLPLLLVTVGLAARADTIHFVDGSTLNGKVSYPNANAVALEFNGSRVVFPATDIESVEENDVVENPGVRSLNPYADAHNKAMLEQTGLTAAQRREVRRLVEPLSSPDPRERATAREQLIAKAKEIELWDYLALCVPSMGMRYVPEVLRVLCELDPVKARKLLTETVEHTCPVHRGSALAMLGMVGTREDTDLIVRGLVDSDEVVQVSAARALAALRDPRATPALIAVLDKASPRVRQDCSVALSRIWSSEDAPVEFETASEWSAFWQERAGTVAGPVSLNSLKPLSIPLPEGVDPTYKF
ncbi:MAG: HEAT repeat domain-containing protein [Candidatus Hydrogenedentes bacterium]|nr:HEAT repeat domain-containing protein [Candidatus Hydrogenedentota bacterium]